MLINWFTVAAQAINFLILVWLLNRFLYKPILRALDEREKIIAAKLADAEANKAEARKQRDDFKSKNEAFDQERAALLKAATDAASAEHQRLLKEAREAAVALSRRQAEAMRDDARALGRVMVGRAQKEVFAIARKTLADLASTSLEERIVEVFLRRLPGLTDDEKHAITGTPSDPLVVRTGFELLAPQRNRLEAAIRKVFSTEAPIRFETGEELVSGIELAANGHKVGWTIDDYLKSLQEGINGLLEEPSVAQSDGAVENAAPTLSYQDHSP